MKVKLKRETLMKPLQQVIGVVDRKQVKPILSHVLIKSEKNKISITGTDLEVELVGKITLETPLNMEPLTVSGRKLIDLCRALPEHSFVELWQERNRVIVKSERACFTLTTLSVKEFPIISPEEDLFSLSVNQQHLRDLLQRTVFAMAQQDIRYYLNGALIEAGKNYLRVIATDGHRLALSSLTSEELDIPIKKEIIVPRKGITELMKILQQEDKPAVVTFGKQTVRVESEDSVLTSKLINGIFPNYGRAIPKQGNKIVIIDKDVLKSALHRVAILCNEKFRGIRLELNNNRLRLHANTPDQEIAEEEINIEYSGEPIEIAFNVNYLLDVLNATDPGLIKLTLSDPNTGILLQEYEQTKYSSCFVIMPMRL